MKMNMEIPLSPGTVLDELPPRASRTMRYKAMMDAAAGRWVVLAVNGTRSANMANCTWVRDAAGTPQAYTFAERQIGGERHLLGRKGA